MTERVEIVNVTPQIAATLLAVNTANRRLKTRVVAQLAESLAGGRFLLAPDAIAVTGPSVRDPRSCLNGQHRLHACVDSGVPFRCILYFGAEPGVYEVCDRQSRRSVADALRSRGVISASLFAATLSVVYAYRRGAGVRR